MTNDSCLEKEALKAKLRDGERIRVIDVRNPDEFKGMHLPDAINIQLDELEKSVSGFDPDILLVTACGKGGGRSAKGAELLRKLGFKAVWLCGGTFGWFKET